MAGAIGVGGAEVCGVDGVGFAGGAGDLPGVRGGEQRGKRGSVSVELEGSIGVFGRGDVLGKCSVYWGD